MRKAIAKGLEGVREKSKRRRDLRDVQHMTFQYLHLINRMNDHRAPLPARGEIGVMSSNAYCLSYYVFRVLSVSKSKRR
jgi:hypothetical protein